MSSLGLSIFVSGYDTENIKQEETWKAVHFDFHQKWKRKEEFHQHP